jgi:putative membrane protein
MANREKWSAPMMNRHAVYTADAAPTEKDQGAIRTLMEANRGLMTWIRTSLSMLSFAFTIYKVLQSFQQAGKVLPRENTPRNVGTFLAVAGTLAIIMGTIEYWHTLKQLRMLQHFTLAQPTLILAVLMCVSGLFLCVTIATSLF